MGFRQQASVVATFPSLCSPAEAADVSWGAKAPPSSSTKETGGGEKTISMNDWMKPTAAVSQPDKFQGVSATAFPGLAPGASAEPALAPLPEAQGQLWAAKVKGKAKASVRQPTFAERAAVTTVEAPPELEVEAPKIEELVESKEHFPGLPGGKKKKGPQTTAGKKSVVPPSRRELDEDTSRWGQMLQPKDKHAVAEKLSAKLEKAPKEVASPSKPKNDVQAKAPLKEPAKAKAVVPTANENNGNPASSVLEEPVSMSKVVTKAKAVALKTTAKKGISANLKDDPPELVSVGVLRAAQGPLDAFFPGLLGQPWRASRRKVQTPTVPRPFQHLASGSSWWRTRKRRLRPRTFQKRTRRQQTLERRRKVEKKRF